MTLPPGILNTTFGPTSPGSLRLVVLTVPLTLLVLFWGLIALIGVGIPPTRTMSQRMGRQAVDLIGAITGAR